MAVQNPRREASIFGEGFAQDLSKSVDQSRSRKRLGKILSPRKEPVGGQEIMRELLSDPRISQEDRSVGIQLIQNREKQQAEQQRQQSIQDILSGGGGGAQPGLPGFDQPQDGFVQDGGMLEQPGGAFEQPAFDQQQGFQQQGSRQQPGGFQQQPFSQPVRAGRPRPEREFTDREILALSQLDPALGKVLQERTQAREKAVEATAKRESPTVNAFIQKLNEESSENQNKRGQLKLQEQAIQEGNLGFFSLANLANLTGIEGLMSPEASVFKTASKEFLLSNISRAGPRPNQWIEKQISDALAKVGRSPAANMSVVAAQRADLDVADAKEKFTDEVRDEHLQKYGFVRENIGQDVNKRMRVFAQDRFNRLEHELRDIRAEHNPKRKDNYKSGKVPEGFPLSRQKAKWYLKRAKNNPEAARKLALKDRHSIDIQEG